jgi:response regulator RpfG family c-di-GMP phosphodiesterase
MNLRSRLALPARGPGLDAAPAAPAKSPALPSPARSFLDNLLKLRLVSPSAADHFLAQSADYLPQFTNGEQLGRALAQAGLLTNYQLDRLLAGTSHGLVIGNYRVLERLGAGGMAVVFLGEHLYMKRLAAIKVFPVDDDCPVMLLERFYAEMRVLADLHHPNIVLAHDAGRLPAQAPGMPALLYLVMEHVPDGDLEDHVLKHGPTPVAVACDWVRQAASGLQAAHDRHLIHRDVKPSNLLLGERGQVKLVDFGLAREFTSQLTDPRALLGTLEYMAPEQSHDASMVSARADVYGLGATLFWLLTGETPYPPTRTVAQALALLQTTRPRRARDLRPDLPPALDDLIDRLLDPDPGRRPALPLAVMNALLPFALADGAPAREAAAGSAIARPVSSAKSALDRRRALVVDDDRQVQTLMRAALEPLGAECVAATTAAAALDAAARQKFDLVLLDLSLPDGDGYEVCRRIREDYGSPHLKVIVVSGRGNQNTLAEALPRGADDYIPKPFELRQLTAKVTHAIRLKEAQERADALARELLLTNTQLEDTLAARTNDVRKAQNALLFAMAKMAESREGETPGHLRRLQQYCRQLAEAVAGEPTWAGVVDPNFLEQLDRCVPLHDIGKIGLPDLLLLKPGKLDDAERQVMQTHAVIGDRMLEALAQEHGHSLDFLGAARAIVRHHHERFDGAGYPDRLAGDAIPASARLVAVADVYDALRRPRFYKQAFSHPETVHIIAHGSDGQFDPALVRAFLACEKGLERVYRLLPM